MKRKTKVFVSSFAALAMSAALATGATYALFTSETQVDVSVSAGNVKINAAVNANSVEMWSRDVQVDGTFVNGGTAVWTDNTVTLERVTPGDKIIFDIDVTNQSDVAIQYRTVVACSSGLDLYEGLSVSLDYLDNTGADVQNFDGLTAYGNWTTLAGGVEEVDTVKVTVEFPYLEESQNQYQGLSTTLYYKVEAVQGNADVTNPAADETVVMSATDLELISRKVANGYSFAGKTVKLGANVDLNGVEWTPIGAEKTPFQGTFDGNGYTVSNVTVDAPNQEFVGFFGYADSATVKNLTVENAKMVGLSSVGAMAGSLYTGKVENCHVKGLVQIEGAYKLGGMFGSGYARSTNCSVIVEDGSYVKATYLKTDLEGDKIGGYQGHFPEGQVAENITVKGLTVEGTRDVGGAFGGMVDNTTVTNVVVDNVKVFSNASEEYIAANVGKITVGGIFGSYRGEGVVVSGSISNATITGVEGTTGEVYGAARGTTAKVSENVSFFNNVKVNGTTYYTNASNVLLYKTGTDVILYDTQGYTGGDTLVVEDGVTHLGNYSVAYANVKKVVLPDTVKTLGRAFNSNTNIEEVVLNEGLETIGNRAFQGCTNLEEIQFPSTLKKIESGAFSKSGLTSVTIPSTVEEIGEQAFDACEKIETFIIEEGVKVIGKSALRNSLVKEITIPSTVVSIGQFAFRDNYELETVHLKCATVPTIGANSFTRMSGSLIDHDTVIKVYNEDVYNVICNNTNLSNTSYRNVCVLA